MNLATCVGWKPPARSRMCSTVSQGSSTSATVLSREQPHIHEPFLLLRGRDDRVVERSRGVVDVLGLDLDAGAARATV
jgi:hypothetical protein